MATRPENTFIRQLRHFALSQDLALWNDGQLLESFLTDKDEAAFALLRRHGAMVLGVCRESLVSTQYPLL